MIAGNKSTKPTGFARTSPRRIPRKFLYFSISVNRSRGIYGFYTVLGVLPLAIGQRNFGSMVLSIWEQAMVIFSYLDNHSLACATQLSSIQVFCAILLLYVTLRTVVMVGRGAHCIATLNHYLQSFSK